MTMYCILFDMTQAEYDALTPEQVEAKLAEATADLELSDKRFAFKYRTREV